MAFKDNNVTVTKTYSKVIGIDPKSAKLLPYVNLNNEEKKKLKLKTYENEPNYVKEKEDKKTGEKYKTLIVELYYKVEQSTISSMIGRILPITFYIDDIERPLGSNSGKMQVINEEGNTAWVFDENDEENMKWWKDEEGNINKNGIKRALNGEVDFMDALNQMFSIRDAFEPFNWKKMFNGDYSELQIAIKNASDWWITKLSKEGKNPNEDFPKFSVLYYVTEKEKDDKTYYVQNVWNSKFTPASIRKELQRKQDSGYPLKGFYKFENTITNYLTEFDPEKNKEVIDDLPF